MKKTICLLAFLISYSVYSQTISLFEIDNSNFPNIKAKFIIYNNDGSQYYPILSELNITENGIKRQIAQISCPEPLPPKALSSVLVMDLSSSMESGRVGSRNIDLAKAAARAWVEGLKLGISECAITGFNDKSILIRDFTTDKDGLLAAINSLQPDGSTNYDAAFCNAPSSSLAISKKGKYQKIIVMLTDGMPNDPPNVSAIVKEANSQNCRIYAVTLGMLCPKVLKEISTQTGGLWFENISNQEQAENVYRKILNTAQGSSPCDIEWISDVSCELSTTNVRFRRDYDSCKASYYPPEDAASRITISPKLINFGIILPRTFKDTIVTLRAINSDYKIDSIKILKGSQDFSFVNPGFPVVIPINQSHKFTLRYTPTDNNKSYTTIEIESQPCKTVFNVSGGMNEIEIPPTLTLTKPNGGETYLVGSDTLITWKGIGSEEKVSLDYSFDNGINWKNITDTATGLKYKWENIPKPASTECLVKVRQNELSALDTAYYKLLWKSIISYPIRIEWNPDGSMIAISSYNGGLTILDNEYKLLLEPFGSYYSSFEISKNIAWVNGGPCIAEAYQYDDSISILDLITHTVINTFGGNGRNIISLTWNPDFTKIASVTYDGSISILDAASGNLLVQLKPKSMQVNCLAWSSDGTKIAVGYDDAVINICDVVKGTIIDTLIGHISRINDIAWCPNENKIVSASSDYTVIIWDINSGKELFSLNGHTDKVNSVSWNFDGSKIASGSDDNSIKIWDAYTGAEITTLTCDYVVNWVSWSPDGKKIGSVLSYLSVQFWDVLNEKIIKTISPHNNSVNSGAWSLDYSKIATGSYDGTVKIWEAEDGNLINTINPGYNVDKVIWSPDGTQIAIRSKIGIDIYDAMTGALVKNTCDTGNYYIKNFIWSPDGTKFAIYTSDNNVKIWDINKDEFIITYYCDGADIKGLYWSPDGIKVAAHFADSYFKIWDISKGKLIVKSWTGLPTINRYVWSPDGKKMLIANAEGRILIWEPYGDNIFKKINGINETVYLMSWKPDGKYIAWFSGSGVTIWDVEKGEQYKKYSGSYDDWNRYRNGIAIFYEFAWTPKGLRFVTGAYQNIVQAWFLDEPALQEDISDSLFQVVEPKVTCLDVDLKQCLVGSLKDSLISNYIINESDYSVRIDSAYIVGADSACFNIISGIPPVEIQAKNGHNLEFSFKPNRVGIHQAKIVIITQADTLIQNISGEGVEPVLSVISDFIDFGIVDVGSPKDSLQAVMIKNIGTVPLTITKTEHALPNAVDFSTLAGGGSFTINPGDTAKLDLRFKPSFVGRTNGSLHFEYNGIESPAIVQLFGEGVRKNPAILATTEKFPTLVCDNKTSINVTLKNEGGKPLEIKQLKIKGTDVTDFSIQDITPITIEPDSSKILIINFTPANAGQKTSDLEIISNAYPDSILTIPLNARKEFVSLIPEVTSIDLGTLCPNETNDTILSIKNAGTILSGGYAELSKSLQTSTNEFIIDTNNIYSLPIKFLGNSQEGVFSENLTVFDSTCGNSKLVTITGNVSLPVISADDVSISALLGNSKEGSIEIKNISNRDVQIVSISGMKEPFAIVGNPFPINISKMGTAQLQISYTPTDKFEQNLKVTFHGQPCEISKELTITGLPAVSSATIELPTISGYPGDIIELPIIIHNQENLQLSGITSLKADLSYNSTLLLPLDNSSLKIDETTNKITLSDISLNNAVGDTLIKVRFKVGLGNADICDLTLSNAETVGGIADITLLNGKFKLLGVCQEGGKRLINPNGKEVQLKISPNPSDGKLSIELNLIEDGNTILKIYDIIGNVVFEENIESSISKMELNIETSKFSNGLYFVSLQTPTIIKIKELIIFR